MKITVEFYVISDPPMDQDAIRWAVDMDLQRVVGIVPTWDGGPALEITGFKILDAEGE